MAAAPVTVPAVPLAPPMTPQRAAAIIAALPPGVEDIVEPALVAAGMFGSDAVAQATAANVRSAMPSDGPSLLTNNPGPDVEGQPGTEPDLRTWPCMQCGARVPFAESVCHDCGAGFMGGGGPISLDMKVPLLSRVLTMPRGQAIVAAGVFGFLVAAVCVGLVWLVADLL